MQGYDNLVSALEVRFDFYSARVVAREAVTAAGLEGGTGWSEDELRRVAQQIPLPTTELDRVCERLGLAPGSTPGEVSAA